MVASTSVMTVDAPAMSSELRTAIEQPRHHVAALIVGAEEIVAELPGRADRRVAQAQAFGRLLHHRNLLPPISVISASRVERNGSVLAKAA